MVIFGSFEVVADGLMGEVGGGKDVRDFLFCKLAYSTGFSEVDFEEGAEVPC